jgi:hypothetical protein
MKKLFYLGLALLVLFEIANVYFIMPMPGSQRMASIDLAYRLYSWRWLFRAIFVLMIVAGAVSAWRAPGRQRFAAPAALVLAALIVRVEFPNVCRSHVRRSGIRDDAPADRNKVDTARLVVGIEVDGQARAFPIQFIGYHHQVRDTVAGKAVMVSYCTV